MEQFSNFVNITLANPCGPGDATIVVNNGSRLPATGTFSALLENEIVTVTNRSGNTLSILRGQEGTTGASHSINTPVLNCVTARSINQLRADILGLVSATPPLLFSVALATVSSVDQIPANATITRVCVLVTTAYTVGTLISVGQTGLPTLLIPASGTNSAGMNAFNAASLGLNDYPMLIGWGGTPLDVLVTISGTSPSVGACTVFVEYALPGD